ncbi:hypothetical protein G5B47_11990 [Paenibacillus sp. 7124]|uniref:Uncharacterized protein n=1 Tax=Paenibacillus apii TaxID=1850370 RepID=A0A6M1PKS8_9BACL|nr:hypothetical protein [Paenibacillus apii]NGM83134.1 hypothetical protein [Paenibacillus apii]NJJ41949.1 hypothetical protein [Paenibacillus apii]
MSDIALLPESYLSGDGSGEAYLGIFDTAVRMGCEVECLGFSCKSAGLSGDFQVGRSKTFDCAPFRACAPSGGEFEGEMPARLQVLGQGGGFPQ